MLKMYCLVLVALVIQNGSACDNDKARAQQGQVQNLVKAYGLSTSPYWPAPYYHKYQPALYTPDLGNGYEGRSPAIQQINPFLGPLFKNSIDSEKDVQQQEGRTFANFAAQLLNSGLFNNRFTASNTFRPFAGLASRLPFSYNPNFAGPLQTFDGCKSSDNEDGICAPVSLCSVFGGRASGSCALSGVCCVNVVTTCSGTITLNNTYWQSPTTGASSSSSCALTVRLDSQLLEQKKKPICQVRLDFISFTIAQPNIQTVCDTDNFQVGGSLSRSPIICGENAGQHMYLQVPNSGLTTTDLQLVFSFGQQAGASAALSRSWKIKIAMLPCGTDYLAPLDCLQYYTATSGRVYSFNWRDVVPAATSVRQLANQDYNICFRTQTVANKRANRICYSVCSGLTNTFAGYAISRNPTAAVPRGQRNNNCPEGDYLTLAGGFDPAAQAVNNRDRYCGSAFNAGTNDPGNLEVCTIAPSFRLYYHTDAAEATTPDAEVGNLGFCLSYTQN